MTICPDIPDQATAVAAIVVVAEDARLGRVLHRPMRAKRARLLADVCDAVGGTTPETSPSAVRWSDGGTTVSMTRAATGGNDGRLLVDLNVDAPDGTPMRGALIHVLGAVDDDIGAMVRPDTLAVTAALLRSAAAVLDGSGPSLTYEEWDAASSAICRPIVERDRERGHGGEEEDPFLAAVARHASPLPRDGVLHDHKPLGPLSRQSLHWHTAGGIHPVEPPPCAAAADVSIDRQGRMRLRFLWRPSLPMGDEDPVATLRAVAALREAEAASITTRPQDRA